MKCCFIGHRDIFDIEEKIFLAIKQLTKDGIVDFYSGGMGNFDKMCEKAVKKAGGNIVFVPYNLKQVKSSDKLWYDKIIYPNTNNYYSKYDIPNRNKWLVENCDIFLCYVYKNGGARTTYDYAIKKKKKIINLYEI